MKRPRQRPVECVRDPTTPNIDVLASPVMPRARRNRAEAARASPARPTAALGAVARGIVIIRPIVFLKKDAPIYM